MTIASHPCSRRKHATSRADVVSFWASLGVEAVVLNRFDVQVDCAIMGAGVCQATRLAGAAVRPKISVTDGRSNSGPGNQKRWSICVHNFDILCILHIDAARRVANTEKGASRVKAHNCVD